MNAVTIFQAQKDLGKLITSVTEDVDPIIICGDEGQKAVLISYDEFSAWQDTLYLLSNPVNVAHLRQSIVEAEAGKSMERELIDS